jgi:hypothetical protein
MAAEHRRSTFTDAGIIHTREKRKPLGFSTASCPKAIANTRAHTGRMAHNHNNSANKAALVMKDETIAHLIQLLSDKQAEYKTALAKKDETIERLIQLLSDKQLRDAPAGAPATNGFSFAAPSATTPATSGFLFASPSATTPATSGFSFAKPAAPAAASATSGFSFAAPSAVSYSFAKPAAPAATPSATTPATSGFSFAKPAVPAAAPATSGFSFAAPSAVSYPFAKPAAPAAAPSTSPFVQGSHPGVSCDRSGMMPIVGMRYHLRGYDYDLCQAEYDKLSEFEKCQYEAMAPH